MDTTREMLIYGEEVGFVPKHVKNYYFHAEIQKLSESVSLIAYQPDFELSATIRPDDHSRQVTVLEDPEEPISFQNSHCN